MNKKNKSSAAVTLIPIVIILLPFLYSIFSAVPTNEDGVTKPFLEKPDPQFTECVRQTEYMRHNHWVLLRAVREDVVRYGKRGEVSLKGCSNCHTSRERFCDKCHEAVSMYPDCFGCHYYP